MEIEIAEYQDEKPNISVFRQPSYTQEEVEALLELVTEHKTILFSKSTNGAMNRAKVRSWSKIARDFNNRGFKTPRSASTLKTKFLNLKNEAKRAAKSLFDLETCDKTSARIIAMIRESDSFTEDVQQTIEDDINCDNDDFGDEDDAESQRCRSSNFSPEECRLLMQCVRSEREYILDSSSSGEAVKQKKIAWKRVVDVFNKKSPTKRSLKVLRCKFFNLKSEAKKLTYKRYVKHAGKGFHTLQDERKKGSPKKMKVDIKKEPTFEDKSDSEYEDHESGPAAAPGSPRGAPADPLQAVLNAAGGGGGGGDFFNHSSYPPTQKETMDIVKFKKEILNYQLETAKLERQRVLNAMEADRAEQESRAIERSLRLRTARLELLAAEGRLSPSHPGLSYSARERDAHTYMNGNAL